MCPRPESGSRHADQWGASGERERMTSGSCQWRMGGMSVNEEGVVEVSCVCSVGEIKGGGEVKGDSMALLIRRV